MDAVILTPYAEIQAGRGCSCLQIAQLLSFPAPGLESLRKICDRSAAVGNTEMNPFDHGEIYVHVDSALAIDQLSDEQLAAEAAREGSDGPAFNALCGRYQERIWRVCCRLVGNPEDARDVAQEVMVTMFMQRTQFRQASRYSTWVHGIAIRSCLMFRRGSGRRRKRETRAFAQRQQRESEGTEEQNSRLDLASILATLDEEDRAMLILKYAEGHSYAELAEMFNKTASACKMRISRARQDLQQRYPEHQFGGDSD